MGIRDSTITRVKPLFDFIGKDKDKLNRFFSLFNVPIPKIEQEKLVIPIRYGKNEKLIPPPKSLLIWMLRNLGELNYLNEFGVEEGSETYKKRKKLFAGDQMVLNEALHLVKSKNPLPKNAWYMFEGYTHPDI